MQLPVNPRDEAFASVDLRGAFRSAREVLLRNKRLIARFGAIGALLAAFYAVFAEPKFTAQSSILIDPRTNVSPENDEAPTLALTAAADALLVDSEIKVLGSREVTFRAAQDLSLFEQEDGLLSDEPSLSDRLLGVIGFGGQDPALDDQLNDQLRLETVRRQFVAPLTVQRSERSYVVDVTYTSPDRVFAADAVNAVIDAYLDFSADRSSDEIDRLNTWLDERLGGLEAEVSEAEAAVAAFRESQALFEVGDDRLPSEIELANATETLLESRERIAALDVAISSLTEQIEFGDLGAVNLEAVDRSAALIAFEARYSELLQEEVAAIQSRGTNSAVVQELRESQAQVEQLIREELRKTRDRMIAQRASLQNRIAESELRIGELRAAVNADAQTQIELRRLTRQAEAKRQLYEELLASYNVSAELSTFDATPARVIARAVPPDAKSEPQTMLVLVVGTLSALALGVTVAFVREAVDDSLRTPDDLRDLTGMQGLGVVPDTTSETRLMKQLGHVGRGRRKNRDLPGNWRKLGRKNAVFRFAVDHPQSVFAETLRAVQINLNWARQSDGDDGLGVCVGFVSAVSGEGKTTTALNFATMLAQQYGRVAIVDLDLVRAELTRSVSAVLPRENVLSTILLEQAPERLQPLAEFDNLVIIGNTGDEELDVANPEDADELAYMLDALRSHFDVVIVDLPPLHGLAEARVMAKMCDRLVFLVHWGTTKRGEVRSALRHLRGMTKHVLGAVYTRADADRYLQYNRDVMSAMYYK